MPYEDMAQHRPTDLLRDTDRDYFGVLRVLNSVAGTPGEEREYEAGDEALVEQGLAEWVVAPVFAPSAGRQLDGVGSAARAANPLGGVEVFPVAGPTNPARRSQARTQGFVEAHMDEGAEEKLAAKRSSLARDLASDGRDDVTLQAELGGLGARSGPASARSELPADQVRAAASAAAGGTSEQVRESQGDPARDPKAASEQARGRSK